VIYDGFQYKSRHALASLGELLQRFGIQDDGMPADHGLALARAIKTIRPEMDIYLVSERNVEEAATSEQAQLVRRVFYEIEELMELHLSLMAGVTERYSTPFFDNLKKYAAKPVGTFHALPLARGKSVFKSNWIKDMGQFYGANLFLAESSATTGGLDSLLDPVGQHQGRAGQGRRAPSAPTTCSSAPTAPPRPTRSWCRRCAGRATSS
jgi:arginine decarboxylase